MQIPSEEPQPITPEALRRAFTGPDLPVRRRYLVLVDGVPHSLREPDDTEPDSDDCGC